MKQKQTNGKQKTPELKASKQGASSAGSSGGWAAGRTWCGAQPGTEAIFQVVTAFARRSPP